MIPSTATAAVRRSPCPCCRRRRRNVAAGSRRPPPVVGSSATARALAAGLWRLRQAERSAARRQDNPASLHGGRKAKQRSDSGVGRHSRSHGNGILDKIEACCMVDDYLYGHGGSMEKATKWDNLKNRSNSNNSSSSEKVRRSSRVVALEAALEKARSQLMEVDDERRVASKKLRKVAEEKAWWKSKARCAAAALREERHHRRQLEAANGKLMKEVASARQRVETERKARELMEAACEELSKEVEEDQAEVEALRRECVAMREEMEEERRMLQMAEVWREERVQMKLSDAKAVLEHKYAHLNNLQSEMESFLRRHHHLRRTVNQVMADANHDDKHFLYKSNHAPDDVDKVFDHFRRKNNNTNTHTGAARSSSPASSDVASPATDLFLEKVDHDDDGGCGGWAWERETPPPRNRVINASTSNNGGVTEGGSGRSRRSGKFNTALIRSLWRSAISESRRKQTAAPAPAPASSSSGSRSRPVVLHNGCSPSYSDRGRNRDRDRDTARSSVIDPDEGGRTASATSQEKEEKDMRKKKSLMEKLMEARMDDHHSTDKPCQPQLVNNVS